MATTGKSLQLNLPQHLDARPLDSRRRSHRRGRMGRSFWILDDITPLRQVNKDTGEQRRVALQACTGPIACASPTNTDTPLPPDEPHG